MAKAKHRGREAGGIGDPGSMLLHLAEHRWFGGLFTGQDELAVVRLLLRAHQASARGEPIHKKAAAAALGVEDVRTARKYVDLAEHHGLLKAVPDKKDKRRELLLPTTKLDRLLLNEIKVLGARIQSQRGSLRVIPPATSSIVDTVAAVRSIVVSARPYISIWEPLDGDRDPDMQAWLQTRIMEASKEIERDSTNNDAVCLRASSYMQLGKFGEAIADFNNAISLYDANDPDGRNILLLQRAECLLGIGRLTDAVTEVEAIVQSKPHFAHLFLSFKMLWRAYGGLGDNKKAQQNRLRMAYVEQKLSTTGEVGIDLHGLERELQNTQNISELSTQFREPIQRWFAHTARQQARLKGTK